MGRRLEHQNITEGVIWKQLLMFFFPILLGTIFQQLYNTVDTIIVGRAVGTQALAAVGATAALVSLINGFFIGLGAGATVLLAQFYGAGDKKGACEALHTGLVLSVILGTTALILGVFGGPWVLRQMGTPENCLADASKYVRIYFGGAVVSMVYNMGAGILRAMGDSRRPLIYLTAACISNIVLDLLFVVVLGMGVAGASLATVLSQGVSAALVLRALARLPEELRLKRCRLRLDPVLMKRILMIGVPTGLQLITFDFANVLIQSCINSFGDVTVAAWTTYFKTDAITWQISGAFGVAITTFVGQNFGAQKYDRVRRSVWTCMGLSIAIVGGFSAVIVVFREMLMGIYTTDLEVIRVASNMIAWVVPFNVIFMPVEVFAGTMRGTGYSVMPTVITCSCACVFRILWIYLVVGRWHSLFLLCMAYPISWVLSATVFFVAYLRGTWLHKRIAQLGMEPERR